MIGRFLQPDPQPTGPELQWGQLNRWAYCANDPVNASDPSGEAISGWGYLYLAVTAATFLALTVLATPLVALAFFVGAIMGMLFEMGLQLGRRRCNMPNPLSDLDWDAVFKSGFATGLSSAVLGLAPNPGFARWLVSNGLTEITLRGGAAFGLGFLFGLTP